MPTWLGQLISSGIVLAVLGALIRFSVSSITKQLNDQASKIDGIIKELHRLEVHFAKTGVDSLKADVEDAKKRLTKLESSDAQQWPVLDQLKDIKRASDYARDKIIKGE